MNPKTESAAPEPARKPRFSLFIATVCGLGYLPKAPGTFGALAGFVIYVGLYWLDAFVRNSLVLHGLSPLVGGDLYFHNTVYVVGPVSLLNLTLAPVIALIGVWAASQVEKSAGAKDPQYVVIDEVSGQQLTYVLALTPLNWKYLLLGFILFRTFDIWKPFPARQAESLPGGWGIMADDWVAAVYAALGLWLARILGL
jgi:phosphatidylglycerophosphatase A